MADYMERTEAASKKVKSAMTYPDHCFSRGDRGCRRAGLFCDADLYQSL